MKQVNNEGSNGDSEDDVPISAINKGKKKVEDIDDDEMPFSFSRAKMKSAENKKGRAKGNAMISKVKKEEFGGSKAMKQVKNEGSNGDGEDDVPISAINKGKKVEDFDDDEMPLSFSRAKENKKGRAKGNAMTSKVKKEESGGSKDTSCLLALNHLITVGSEKAMKQVKNEGSNGDGEDDVPISAINKGKKVEDFDDDEMPLSFSRAKENKKGRAKGNAMTSKVKKEESGGSKENMEKKVKKGENKKENIKEKDKKPSSSGKVKTERVKKVYDLPGQKHDPPEERDPVRIFYESLYNQNPNSEMAQVWMMERGLLSEDKAKKVFEKKKQKGIASPAKPTPIKKSPASSSSVKSSLDTSSTKKGKAGTSEDNPDKNKKRKADSDYEEDSDDDFIAPSKQIPRKKQKVSD